MAFPTHEIFPSIANPFLARNTADEQCSLPFSLSLRIHPVTEVQQPTAPKRTSLIETLVLSTIHRWMDTAGFYRPCPWACLTAIRTGYFSTSTQHCRLELLRIRALSPTTSDNVEVCRLDSFFSMHLVDYLLCGPWATYPTRCER